jgi:hypothetical protein
VWLDPSLRWVMTHEPVMGAGLARFTVGHGFLTCAIYHDPFINRLTFVSFIRVDAVAGTQLLAAIKQQESSSGSILLSYISSLDCVSGILTYDYDTSTQILTLTHLAPLLVEICTATTCIEPRHASTLRALQEIKVVLPAKLSKCTLRSLLSGSYIIRHRGQLGPIYYSLILRQHQSIEITARIVQLLHTHASHKT